MIAIALSHYAVTVSFRLVPLALIDVFVGVNHPALALGHSVNPVAIVAVPVFVEKSSTSVFFVFEPIAGILTSQLFVFVFPISSLAMTLVNRPHALVLVTVLVVLDAKTFFAIVSPVANIFGR